MSYRLRMVMAKLNKLFDNEYGAPSRNEVFDFTDSLFKPYIEPLLSEYGATSVYDKLFSTFDIERFMRRLGSKYVGIDIFGDDDWW